MTCVNWTSPVIGSLGNGQLKSFSLKLLDDLKAARDRLNQTPKNGSMPSGSQTPWAGSTEGSGHDETDFQKILQKKSPQNPVNRTPKIEAIKMVLDVSEKQKTIQKFLKK